MCAGRSSGTIYKAVDQIDPNNTDESRHWKFHSHFDSVMQDIHLENQYWSIQRQ